MQAIEGRELGKAYKQYASQWARLGEWVMPWLGARHSLHWVLNSLNFEIGSGEAVGIVGVNGAGKSTLLKLITGTIQPTTGSIQVTGHVAALLELGMGFHPDFTGRQNVVMAAQLLGLRSEEIEDLMPAIESFADIGEYIDLPVRIYSSGMQVRLAFSVATAIRPDVLIVDEVLSVGDAAFQRKCFQRIEAFRDGGTTLLLVSHDVETVKKLCNKAMFLRDGHIANFGVAKTVCDEYERFLFGDQGNRSPVETLPVPEQDAGSYDPGLEPTCETAYGNGRVDILACWIENSAGRRVNVVEAGSSFSWCYRIRFNEYVSRPVLAMMLKSVEGVSLYGVDSTVLGSVPEHVEAGTEMTVCFKLKNTLGPGTYYLNCGVRQGHQGYEYLARRVDSAILKVVESSGTTVLTGFVELSAELGLSD